MLVEGLGQAPRPRKELAVKLHRTGDPTFTRTPRSLRWRRREQPHAGAVVAAPDTVGANGTPAEPAPQPSIGTPAPVPASQAEHGSHMLVDEVTGANLLLADLRTMFILANEARYRTFERVLGLPRSQANIATFVATVMLAEAAHARLQRLLSATAPSPGDLALGTATVRYLMLGSAEGSAPPVPMFGALAAIAAGGTVVIPAAVKSVRGVRAAAREVGSFFSRRYGHRVSR
jgi:hypothetical protein